MVTRRLPTAQRREQPADAALRLLSTEGARAVTVKNIAKQVGITDGAVFRHFPDVSALFEAAVERFDSQLPSLPSDELDPLPRLGEFFVARVRVVQSNPDIMSLTLSDRLQELVGGAAAERVQARIVESMAFVGRALRDARERGELDEALAPEVVTWMITGAMRGAARSGADPELVWDGVRRAIFKRRRRRKS
jgi:AcrR family transcriptional regulator